MMKLFDFQQAVLDQTKDLNRVAYYLDMGLGKTFVGSRKMMQLNARINLVICQKSKVQDWVDHFLEHYERSSFVCGNSHDGDCDNCEYEPVPDPDGYSFPLCPYQLGNMEVIDLTKKDSVRRFFGCIDDQVSTKIIGIINYELAFRRPDLLKLKNFTLMLDESSLICNEYAKRSKFILKMKPQNVILLSGTPTSGKYEKLWSQCILLGWYISKQIFWNSYMVTEWKSYGGFLHQEVTGYKNVDHLKKKLAEHGAVFLKTDEVMELPDQVQQKIYVNPTSDYKKFMKNSYLMMKDGTELIGDNSLTKILYARKLCGEYNKEKLQAFNDLLNSTEGNLVVFYNFTSELEQLMQIAVDNGRHPGIVNGKQKDKPEGHDILFVQYQAGAYGLNLQEFSNRIIYFTLPLGKGSCDMWEQSKKRIHRIGQKQTCFYYYILVRNSVEMWNLQSLQEGKDLTDKLFERMAQDENS